jgi:hypothetical protein
MKNWHFVLKIESSKAHLEYGFHSHTGLLLTDTDQDWSYVKRGSPKAIFPGYLPRVGTYPITSWLCHFGQVFDFLNALRFLVYNTESVDSASRGKSATDEEHQPGHNFREFCFCPFKGNLSLPITRHSKITTREVFTFPVPFLVLSPLHFSLAGFNDTTICASKLSWGRKVC